MSAPIPKIKTGLDAPPPTLLMTVLIVGHAIKHFSNALFFVILPEIGRTFSLSNTAIGTLSTARNLATSVSNLPAGFVADRYNRHWAAILSIAMLVIGTFQYIMGSVDSYWPLLIAAAIAGGAIAFWHPPAIAALSQRFPQRRGFVISLHGTGGSVGEAMGPLIVGSLLSLMTWHTVLKISLLPPLGVSIMVWALIRSMRGQTRGNLSMGAYLGSLRPLLRRRALVIVLLVTGFFNMAQSAISTFLPVYIRLDLEYSAIEMAAFLSAAQVAGIVSQPLLGLLSDRFGRRAVLVPSLLCLSAGILIVGVVPRGWPLAVTITAMGAFQFPLMALFLASAMDIVGEEVQATIVSLVFGIGTIFGSISPALAGFLADNFGLPIVFFYAAAVASFASALLFFGGGGWSDRRG
ncbi:MAG: MFS transporter [Dehalococcoidia bacterium]|nr:MFS transporter [Dehalococcoidia bacterium]